MFGSDYQSVMNRIMLRFRPIAPKPVVGGEVSGAAELEKENDAWRKAERKSVRYRGRRGRQSSRTKITEEENKSPPPGSSAVADEHLPEKFTVTLQLLPERSETDYQNQGNWMDSDRCNSNDVVSYEVTSANSGDGPVDFQTVGSVIETLIIVERITDWSVDQVGLGFSDREKIYRLEKDTCPGFISDWMNNVIWVNEAYRKTVATEMGVLVVRDELPRFYPSFACRVSVIQQRGKGQKWNKLVPCDVWRMVEFAGFAWKLDVNTALSLSL